MATDYTGKSAEDIIPDDPVTTAPPAAPPAKTAEDYIPDDDATSTTTPPISEWPGIIGQTLLHAAEPFGYAQYAQGSAARAALGQPEMTPEQFAAAGPKAPPQYGGALGFGQRFAETAGSPIGLTGLILAPEATIGGDIASEAVRQLGGDENMQLAAGAAGGLFGPGMISAVARGGGRVAESLAARLAAPEMQPEDVAKALGDQAGVAPPDVNTPANIKHEAGKVIQRSIDESAPPAPVTATGRPDTARTMAGRAAKAGPAPEPTPGEKYIQKVSKAPTPSQSVDAALSNPDQFKALPSDGQAALGHWVASDVKNNPDLWLKMDPAHQQQIVPDPVHRAALTAAANRESAAQAAAKISKQKPSFWQNLPSTLLHTALHHGTRLGAGAGIGAAGSLVGLPSPYAELGGAALTYLGPRTLSGLTRDPLQAINPLVGAGQAWNANQLAP